MNDNEEQKSEVENTYTYHDLPHHRVIQPEPSRRGHWVRHGLYLASFVTAIMTAGLVYAVQTGSIPSSYATQKSAPTTAVVPLSPTKTPVQSPKREVIGFLPSWSVAKNLKVRTQNLTQIIYFGLAVNDRGELVKYNEQGDAILEWQYLTSPYFDALKKEATEHRTKVLVAIKNFDNENIDNLIANQQSSSRFINQVVDVVEEADLDGVNVDFEYFTDSDFPTFKYFNRFLNDLNIALKKSDPTFLLSIDINATAVLSDRAYDMVKIGEVVDQVIIMGYDYSRAPSTRAGHVAPLYAPADGYSLDQSVKSLTGRVPAEKIILALPFYGYEWQTTSTRFQSPTIEHTGALATYGRVQKLIESRNDIELHWDETAAAPWLTYYQSGAIKQIYYEDERSWATKLAYVQDHKLLGVGIWALGYDGDDAGALWKSLTDFRL